MVMKMRVIYADILFIINLYITYFLLLFTCLVTKSTVKRVRLLLSSIISAFYSLIILLPGINDTVIALSRIPALALIILISFRRQGAKQMLKLFLSFLLVNISFAGLMLLLWVFGKPSNMYFNSGIIYFDIGVTQLIVTTAVCYFVLKAVHKLICFKTPSDTMYDLEIFFDDKRYFCKSLLDTGNTLTDSFTGSPVIVVSKEVLKGLTLPDLNNSDTLTDYSVKFRFILCNTVSGDGILPAFKPQKVRISAFKGSFETDRVMIAVTERRLKNGAFGAILPCTLPIRQTKERGAIYEKENT